MIDDTGTRITALERRVAEIEARMVAQPIRATNSSGTPSLADPYCGVCHRRSCATCVDLLEDEMTPADKSDAERIAALEAEVKVLREWLAALSQVARTTYPEHLPGIYPQPFTPNPWPYSPFAWGTDGTGTQPPGCPQPTVRSAP